ncbi:MAG: magnesium/cobalt transporter CorA [Vulcanimicrobiota bacterium]
MARKRRRRKMHRQPAGEAPGLLIASPEATATKLHYLSYGPDHFAEQTPGSVEDVPATEGILWFNVEGLADTQVIELVGQRFGLHRLALEDVLYSHQPKAESFGEHLLISLPMLHSETVEIEQMCLFFGRDFVLSFQEGVPGDCLEPVRRRLRESKGQIRSRGADYLAYAVLDAVIDAYFPLVDRWGHTLSSLEEKILENPSVEVISSIRHLRRQVADLRRTLRQLRDGVGRLLAEAGELIHRDTLPFFRDCHEHVAELLDILERHRETTTELLEAYHSRLSQRSNEIMQTLTVIATIFIPLSFIAGVYGMNFDPKVSPYNMPELGWAYGYPFALGLMLTVALGFVVYFYRKGWLGGED